MKQSSAGLAGSVCSRDGRVVKTLLRTLGQNVGQAQGRLAAIAALEVVPSCFMRRFVLKPLLVAYPPAR